MRLWLHYKDKTCIVTCQNKHLHFLSNFEQMLFLFSFATESKFIKHGACQFYKKVMLKHTTLHTMTINVGEIVYSQFAKATV